MEAHHGENSQLAKNTTFCKSAHPGFHVDNSGPPFQFSLLSSLEATPKQAVLGGM